jgi:P pilus assembly chaperone PapD
MKWSKWFVSSVALLFVSFSHIAAPNIHFTDYRILLTDKKVSSNYQIFNQGNSEAYCYTSVVDHQVAANGKLTLVKNNDRPETSAIDMLRISPRRVAIPPMSSQKLKVVARKLRQQDDGEWVSYMSLKCKDSKEVMSNGLNMSPNFIFNIPVVVRKGDLEAKAQFEKIALTQQSGQYFADVSIRREGERSLYGNIMVFDDTGLLAIRKGLSHYLQSNVVSMQLPLKQAPKGKVKIEFIEQPQFGGDIHLKRTL